MGLIKTADLLVRARDALVNLKSERNEYLSKLAETENELKLLNSTLDLVHRGLIDTTDIFDKLAEFREDPTKPDLIKQAAELGYSQSSYTMGQVTDQGNQTKDVDGNTPEEKLTQRLQNLVGE